MDCTFVGLLLNPTSVWHVKSSESTVNKGMYPYNESYKYKHPLMDTGTQIQ